MGLPELAFTSSSPILLAATGRLLLETGLTGLFGGAVSRASARCMFECFRVLALVLRQHTFWRLRWG